MSMSALDSIYFVAYALFLAGASLTLRRIRPGASLWVMVAGVVIDFFATVIPCAGFKSLAIGIGSSPAIVSAISLGVGIWTAFLAAVFIRLMGRQALFHTILIFIKIFWFIDLVLFMYGVYAIEA